MQEFRSGHSDRPLVEGIDGAERRRLEKKKEDDQNNRDRKDGVNSTRSYSLIAGSSKMVVSISYHCLVPLNLLAISDKEIARKIVKQVFGKSDLLFKWQTETVQYL